MAKQLKILSQQEAIERANEKIADAMSNKHIGLYSRWPRLNEVIGGRFEFGRILTIAGPSGSGKSYLLNMLREDFVSEEINGKFYSPYKVLSFSLEMDSADEIIRTYSGHMRMSYSELMSAHKKLEMKKFEAVKAVSTKIASDKMFYVEEPGNRNEIWTTICKFYEMHKGSRLVITIDHTLLMEYLDEKSEIELVSQLSRLAMKIKKTFGALVILLGQLNDKIEQIDRRSPETPHLHYPTKTDLHGLKVCKLKSNFVSLNKN